MGRIDEALTRASRGDGPIAAAHAHQRQFISPWGEEQHPPGSNGSAPPAVATAAAVVEPDVPDAAASEPLLIETPFDPGVGSLTSMWGERLTWSTECHPAIAEQFRRLAAVLHKAQAATNIKRVMVVSASPGDGKTSTSINLALALSDSYKRRVLLVDADLRRPSIGRVVGLRGTRGLSEALKAPQEEKLRTIPLSSNLTLLPGGAPDPDPMSSLTSERMRRIMEEAAAHFDWVIIDAPPIGPVADAHLLAEIVDTSLFVVRAGCTQFSAVEKAIDTLGRENVLGVVLNAVAHDVIDDYGYY